MNTFTEEEDSEAVMQQAIDNLQRLQQEGSQQVSALRAEMQDIRQEVTAKIGSARGLSMDQAESLRKELADRLDSAAAHRQDQEADFSVRWSICEKMSEEVRRSAERRCDELQAAVDEARRRHSELKDRLNFHENLIMDEQHGSRNAAVAVSTSARLDTVVSQLEAIQQEMQATTGLQAEIGKLKEEQQGILAQREDRSRSLP